MTAINALDGMSGTGGYANPCVSVDVRSYGSFIGWPPAGFIETVQRDVFFAGDGAASSTKLMMHGVLLESGTIDVTAMHQTDWQGRVQLSNQPRTNRIMFSGDLSNAAWIPTNLSVTANAARWGEVPYWEVTALTTANPMIQQNYNVIAPPGQQWAMQFALRAGASTTCTLNNYYNGSGIAVNATATVLSGPGVVASGGASPHVTGLSATEDTVVLMVGEAPATGTPRPTMYIKPGTQSIGDSVLATGAMMVQGSDCGAYIPTTTAAVTVTDYTVDSSGNVTLGQAPAVGATLDWDGTGQVAGMIDIRAAPASTMTYARAAAAALAINANASRSYMDDYYYRVHLRPDRLDLGQLSTAQQRSIEVWNAYTDQSLILNSVLASHAEGITVTAPGSFPFTFAPLQYSVWQVSVTPNGPGKIDATLAWLFADPSQDVQLEITGNRLTAWTVLPDWSQGITETLAWLTDVGEAVDGSQARIPLRGDPRRQWEAPYIAYGTDRQLAESLLYGAAARNYVVPVWWDGDVLTAVLGAGSASIPLATAGRDYAVGAQMLLWRSATNYELVEVASIAADAITLANPTVNIWPAGTRVWPCRQAALTDTPQLTRKNDRLIEATIRFEARETCDWTAIAPTTMYAGYPVLEQRIEESNDPTAAYARKLVTLDNQIALPDVDDFSGLAWPTQSHAWLLSGRATQSAHRSLLYWLAGRAQPLWIPSWQDDVTLTGPVAANATTLNVAWAGIARYLTLSPGRRRLRIELNDGTVLYRAVTAAVEVGQQSENLAIDAALGIAVDPTTVRAISWMMLATLAGDSVDIQHVTDGDGVAQCAVSFAGVPMEEP